MSYINIFHICIFRLLISGHHVRYSIALRARTGRMVTMLREKVATLHNQSLGVYSTYSKVSYAGATPFGLQRDSPPMDHRTPNSSIASLSRYAEDYYFAMIYICMKCDHFTPHVCNMLIPILADFNIALHHTLVRYCTYQSSRLAPTYLSANFPRYAATYAKRYIYYSDISPLKRDNKSTQNDKYVSLILASQILDNNDIVQRTIDYIITHKTTHIYLPCIVPCPTTGAHMYRIKAISRYLILFNLYIRYTVNRMTVPWPDMFLCYLFRLPEHGDSEHIGSSMRYGTPYDQIFNI